ncbi:MAG: glycogen debranching protein GlgX [Actinomycetales bacterium]|nr:glycogen debranching protein GlgX [Actinomycetales bacterium]
MTRVVEQSAPGYPSPLGARVHGSGINVAVRVPEVATGVQVSIYDDAAHHWRHVALTRRTGGVVHGWIDGVRPGARYGIRVDGPWDPARGLRFNAAKLLLDPYGLAVDGRWDGHVSCYGYVFGNELMRNEEDSAGHVPTSVVVEPADVHHFDWGGVTAPRTPMAESVIYEVHAKGFTKLMPGVPEHLRGTYAGMAHPAAVEHLVSLGVTAVELLPVYEVADEAHLIDLGLTNYWGYNPISWFAPRGAYAAAGSRGQQVREFKEMVKALHSAGIEVLLDVVYNHSGEAGALGPTLSLRGLDEGAYYQRSADGAHHFDATGCGNTLDATNPTAMALILDSLRYWVSEMHVDGFRFDLAPQLARVGEDIDFLSACISAVGQDPILSQVKLIAEPWDIGPGGYQFGNFPANWHEWNDRYRDAVREFWRGDDVGVAEISKRIAGSADVFGPRFRPPAASVNFVTAHDGFTMRDLVSYNSKHNLANGESNRDGTTDNRSWNCGVEGETDNESVLELRRRHLRNLMATLVLSTGVPMLVAGDEFGRTQRGNNNAYSQDNEISWLDWDLQPWQEEMLNFTRRLIAIRKHHPALRRPEYASCEAAGLDQTPELMWFATDGEPMLAEDWKDLGLHAVAGFFSGRVPDPDRTRAGSLDTPSFLVLLNAGSAPVEFSLPGAPYGVSYRRVVNTAEEVSADAPWLDHAGDTVEVAANSLVALIVLG